MTAAAADARALGVDPESLPAAAADSVCRVLAENWDAVRAFRRLGTQWRQAHGVVLGLDYAGARAAVRGMIADGRGTAARGEKLRWRDLFWRFQTMEGEVLALERERDRP